LIEKRMNFLAISLISTKKQSCGVQIFVQLRVQIICTPKEHSRGILKRAIGAFLLIFAQCKYCPPLKLLALVSTPNQGCEDNRVGPAKHPQGTRPQGFSAVF